MRGVRPAVVLTIVLISGLFVPVAMASSDCLMMSAMCEGPCGALVAVSAPTAPRTVLLVSDAPSAEAPAVPESEAFVLEPPPEPPLPL